MIKNDGAHPRFYTYSDFFGKAFPKLGLMNVDLQEAQPFADPLLFKGKLRARLFKEMDDMSFYIRNSASKLSVPLLVAHGGIDTITKPASVRQYFDSVGTKDKDIILYDD